MTDHKGLPVKGYTDQPEVKINIVNQHKVMEEEVLRRMDRLKDIDGIDGRWLAIARTNIEQGFMALNRAVFQPQRIQLPEDEA